ncbi:MAG: hypothetical protein RL009_1004 [Actinomycetota bacterium]
MHRLPSIEGAAMNIPVIQFADGLVLVEPSDDELRAALVERSLI